jgi:hypothetical protein
MFKTNVWDMNNELLDKLENCQKSKAESPIEWTKIIKEHDESIKKQELKAEALIAQMLEKSAKSEINSHILHLLCEKEQQVNTDTNKVRACTCFINF